MSTFTEQISAVRKSQVEAQLNFFQNFTAKAVESAQKIMALNLSVSRASMEKSSAAMADMLTAKDPRDLFALTKRTQESIDTILAYNRELVAIATGAAAENVAAADESKPALALVKAAPAAPTVPTEAFEPAPPVAAFVAPVAEPEIAAPPVATATPAAPPEAAATPIAKAAGKVVSKTVAAKPAAAPIEADSAKPVVVKGIKPVDATPPSAPVAGKPAIAQQQLDLPAAKTKKKK